MSTLLSGLVLATWLQSAVVLSGTVTDSLTNAAVPNARVMVSGTSLEGVTNKAGRFSIAGVAAGPYTIEVRTPSLDSVNMASRMTIVVADSATDVRLRVPNAAQIIGGLCGTRLKDGTAVVTGTVGARSDTTSRRGIRVVAEWQEFVARNAPGNAGLETPTRFLEASADSLGIYRLCGLPVSTSLLIRPESDNAAAANAPSLDLTIPPERLLWRADLALALAPVIATGAPAVFTGVVVTDSTRQPVSGADVAFPDLSLKVTANDSGKFRLEGIPAGTHRVVVRHLGYGALTVGITFAGGDTLDRQIVLSRVVTLDSVRVESTAFQRGMESFEDNKKTGLGRFYTRADIEKLGDRPLSQTIATIPSAKVVRGRGTAVLTSNRPKSMGGGCLAQVYVDNAPMYLKRGDPPFNLDAISADQIEAMEYYSGPAQTPLKYSTLNSQCGVLVIWTRRKAP